MAENENIQTSGSTDPQQAPEQQEAPVFQMQRCYLKDASLEMPHAPEILMQPQQEAPQVDIQFEVSQRAIQADLIDVTVRGTVTVKAGEKGPSSSSNASSPAFSPFAAFRLSRCSMSRMCSARRSSIRTCALTSPT